MNGVATLVVALSFVCCAPSASKMQQVAIGQPEGLSVVCEEQLALLDHLLRREKDSPTTSRSDLIVAEELRITGFELYCEGQYDLALELFEEAIHLLT